MALLQGSSTSGRHAVPSSSEGNVTAETGRSGDGVGGSLCDPAAQTSAEVASGHHTAHPNGSGNSAENAWHVGRKRPLEEDFPGHTVASNGLKAGSFGNGESCRQEAERTDLSRERGIAVAAAAFAEGTAKAGAMAVVDLKSPDWVLNVDVLPVGGRSLCALCLVGIDCVTIRPKLTMKQIGS